ncbi:MAG: transporter ATP-binding protein [Candidatus Eremiobacteraeota bacterium]|jgi:branched-chain amino acid transport system ATP-binding protein|nr:transporter ATP-binding protein [Candidatus Eremiobacteraeota bacterium]
MVSVQYLDVAYGRVPALHDVHVEIPHRTIVAVLGPNGAGKSTLLKTISGIVRPRRGRIVADGEDVTHADPAAIVRRGIVHCPEGRHVFPEFTVEENLRVGAYTRGDLAAMDSVLEMFPVLRERLRQLAGTLSGGEQQMLAIGRALMARPRVLLLDEPSLGLAPLLVERIFAAIARLRDDGMTIALVEQNAALALAVADRAYLLVAGRIRFAGEASALAGSELLHTAYLGGT